MGHCTVLVIGENAQDQFDKFQRAEYAHPTQNRHFVVIDVLEENRARYARETQRMLRDAGGALHDPWDARFWRPLVAGDEDAVPTTRPIATNLTNRTRQYVPEGFREEQVPVRELQSFREWITRRHGFKVLEPNETPDLADKHRGGWLRVDPAGEIVEAMDRTIPGGEWDWFERTIDVFKLKPGASGLSIRDGERVVHDRAGAARKGDIDFDAMRADEAQADAALWDRAAAARGALTWIHYDELCRQHGARMFDYASPAWQEYRAQPAIEAMVAAGLESDLGACLDALALPRAAFITRDRYRSLRQFGYVVKDGEMLADGIRIHLSHQAFDAMMDALPDDTLLTAALVHA